MAGFQFAADVTIIMCCLAAAHVSSLPASYFLTVIAMLEIFAFVLAMWFGVLALGCIKLLWQAHPLLCNLAGSVALVIIIARAECCTSVRTLIRSLCILLRLLPPPPMRPRLPPSHPAPARVKPTLRNYFLFPYGMHRPDPLRILNGIDCEIDDEVHRRAMSRLPIDIFNHLPAFSLVSDPMEILVQRAYWKLVDEWLGFPVSRRGRTVEDVPPVQRLVFRRPSRKVQTALARSPVSDTPARTRPMPTATVGDSTAAVQIDPSLSSAAVEDPTTVPDAHMDVVKEQSAIPLHLHGFRVLDPVVVKEETVAPLLRQGSRLLDPKIRQMPSDMPSLLSEQTTASVCQSLHNHAVEDTLIDQDVQMEEPSFDDELANLMASLVLVEGSPVRHKDDSFAVSNPYVLHTTASAYESLHQEHTLAPAYESMHEEQTSASVRASLPVELTVEDTLIDEDMQMEESYASMSHEVQTSNPMPSRALVADPPVAPVHEDSFSVPVPMRQFRPEQAVLAGVPLPDDDDEPAAVEDALEAGDVQADDELFIGDQYVVMPSAATREDTAAVQPTVNGDASFWSDILQQATVLDEELFDLLSAADPDIPSTTSTITSAASITQPATANAVGSAPSASPSPSVAVDVDAVRSQLEAEAGADDAWFDELIVDY